MKIAPFSVATVIGQIWKMPGKDDRPPLRGVTAQAIWSDEDAVVAPSVSANDIEPESDDELPADESEFE